MSAVFSFDVCRLCLWKANSLMSIFGPSGVKQGVANKIRRIFPFDISKDDSLPKGICSNCMYKLEMFYEFYNACVTSNSKLRKYMPSTVQPPVVFILDEAEDDNAKVEILEDPIAITSADLEENFNVIDSGGEHSDQDKSPVWQNDQTSHDISKKRNGTDTQQVSHNTSDDRLHNDTINGTGSTVQNNQTSPRIPVKSVNNGDARVKETSQNGSTVENNCTFTQNMQPSANVSVENHSLSSPGKVNDSASNLIHNASFSDNEATVTSSSTRTETASKQPKMVSTASAFHCHRCSQAFRTRALLTLHYCCTPRDQLFNCRYCDKTFKTMRLLSIHKKVHNRASYTCKECSKKFESLKAMKSHKVTECQTVKAVTLDHMYSTRYGQFGGKNVYCVICKKDCTTAAVYGKHIRSKEHKHNLNKIRHRRSTKITLGGDSDPVSITDKNVDQGNVTMQLDNDGELAEKVNRGDNSLQLEGNPDSELKEEGYNDYEVV